MRKKWLIILDAMLVSGGILLLFFALGGFYPFGENTIVWGDMSQQVVPLLGQFRAVLQGDSSLFYNVFGAGGMNFWGVFLFFLASPFSFLVAFVKTADLYRFMNVLLLLKICTISGVAAFFFRKVFRSLKSVFVVFLSVSYAFCGYTMLFYQNIVWLDFLYLLPLLVLALIRLEKVGCFVPYALCLTLIVAVNFYLSFMIIAFLVLGCGLYFLFYANPETRTDRIVKLAAGTLAAALLSAPFWLPSLLQYVRSARGGNLLQNLSTGDFFTRFDTIGILLLCSGMIFPAVFALIFRVFRRESISRTARFGLTLFFLMLIPVFIEPINKMWHTGSYQAFPGRYGFITVFIGLVLCARYLAEDRTEPKSSSKGYVLVYAALFLATVLCGVVLWKHYRDVLTKYSRTLWSNPEALKYMLLFFVLAVACYGMGFYLHRMGKMTKRLLGVFFAVLVVAEALFYCHLFVPQRSDTAFRQAAETEGQIVDDSFYRVKTQSKQYDVNLTGALGYPSLGHYTSLTSKNYMQGIRKLGYSSYWMEVSSVGGTILTDALLNQKYTIEKNAAHTQNAVFDNGIFEIRKNDLFVPLGVVTSTDLSQYTELPFIARPFVGEYMLEALLSEELSLVEEFSPKKTPSPQYDFLSAATVEKPWDDYLVQSPDGNTALLEYFIPASDEARVFYFDCFHSLENNLRESYYKAFSVSLLSGGRTVNYPTQSENGILEIALAKGEDLTILVEVLDDVTVRSFGVFSLPVQKTGEALNRLRTGDFSVQKSTISGSCTAERDGEYLFLSVSYDPGFTATVNGKKTEVVQVFDTFMAIPLQKGENQVQLRYFPPGMKAGLLLCAAGGVLLAGAYVFFRKKRSLAWAKKLFAAALGAVWAGALGILYVLPVAVFILNRLHAG